MSMFEGDRSYEAGERMGEDIRTIIGSSEADLDDGVVYFWLFEIQDHHNDLYFKEGEWYIMFLRKINNFFVISI